MDLQHLDIRAGLVERASVRRALNISNDDIRRAELVGIIPEPVIRNRSRRYYVARDLVDSLKRAEARLS